MQASLSQGVPMAFGVLTVNSLRGGRGPRADGPGNKGYEAAVAAVDDGAAGAGVAAASRAARERGVTRDPQHLRQARESALQMLYGWEMSGDALPEAIAGVRDLQLRPPVAERDALAVSLAQGTRPHPRSHRPADCRSRAPTGASSASRSSIVSCCAWPSTNCSSGPTCRRPVVINEALELARTFSGPDAVRFVNGVLDAIRKRLDEERAPGRNAGA